MKDEKSQMTLVIYDMLVNKVMLYTWEYTSFHKIKI
jgi:hypothetical protein